MTVLNAGILPGEQNKRVTQFRHDRYISFSSKFAAYLTNVVCEKHTRAHTLVLSGAAGLGKSAILQNEFVLPLQKQNVLLLRFNFQAGENIHNHFFLRSLSYDLALGWLTKRLDDVPASLGELQEFFANPNVTSLDHNIVNRLFLDTAGTISRTCKIVLVFEDVHFARDNFAKFIDEVNRHPGELDLDLLVTTRLKHEEHQFNNRQIQKWVYLKSLPQKSIRRYMESIRGKHSISTPFAEYAISLSNGNPFFIKELCLLEADKTVHNVEFVSDQLVAASSNKLNITLLRLRSLTSHQKQILKVFAGIGFECNKIELMDILLFLNIQVSENTLDVLEEKAFIICESDVVRFQHQFIYDSLFLSIPKDDLKQLDVEFFHFYNKPSRQDIERLAHHSYRAGLNGFACVFAKRLGEKFRASAQYELAAFYHERQAELIPLCSNAEKATNRLAECYISLHAIYLILGVKDKAETIANSLALISQTIAPRLRAEVYATVARSYWMASHLSKAKHYAQLNVDLARLTDEKASKIGALVRYGTLCSEMGEYKTAIAANDEALPLIAQHEQHEKFDLLVHAYCSITSVDSVCYSELGDFQKAQGYIQKSLADFDRNDDSFSKLFIVAYVGYAMLLTGDFQTGHRYLSAGAEIFNQTKASILGPVCLALLGMFRLRLGETAEGIADFQTADRVLKSTSQRHKTGMIDLLYLESLLICFDTNKFAELIDIKIEKCLESEQKSYVAWMYFLKAVFHLFYRRSETGFIGAIAKANIIAQSLDMGVLLQSITRLISFDRSGVFGFAAQSDVAMSFFDRAQFFHDLTCNIRPIGYHKKV